MDIFDLDLNEYQKADIKKIAKITKYGAKSIDVLIRVDGRDYGFEADWLKEIVKDIDSHPKWG